MESFAELAVHMEHIAGTHDIAFAVEAYVIGDGLGTAQVGEEREGDGRRDRWSGRGCLAKIGKGKDDIEVAVFTGDFIECHGGLLLLGDGVV